MLLAKYKYLDFYYNHIYYPPKAVCNLYTGIYKAGYISFVYKGAFLPWIIGINKAGFLTLPQKLCNTQICIFYH